MNIRIPAVLASSLAICVTTSSSFAQLAPYSEDFESLDQASPTALSDTGWLVFGNVFDQNNNYQYGYGPFGAPNGGPAFSAVALNEGGPDQGAQQLVTYSDYNNGDHNIGFLIETNVFQEQIVGTGDLGKTFTFEFDAKLGDIQSPSTALAFIKIIDSNTFLLDGYASVDTTNLPVTWGTYSVSLTIDANHIGDFFQIGFQTTASNYTPSGIVYDNIDLDEDDVCGTTYCGSGQNPNNTALIAIDTCDSSSPSIMLSMSNAPANQFAYLLVGNGSSTVSQPAGAVGDLCVAGGACLGRYDKDAAAISMAGTFSTDIMNAVSNPCGGAVNIDPGATWNFQFWHRQPMGMLSTFSDAITVTFN